MEIIYRIAAPIILIAALWLIGRLVAFGIDWRTAKG